MQDIERKFLVTDNTAFDHISDTNDYEEITQGYIQNVQGRYIYRLKQTINMKIDDSIVKKDSYFQTIKSKEIKVREEYAVELSRDQFTQLWPLCKNMSLTKKRYDIVFLTNPKIIKAHIDVYKNTLKGLNVIEVKFNNVKDCDEFNVPNWFGQEVTDKTDYANYVLVEFGMPNEILA